MAENKPPTEHIKGQRTLFDLQKVVKLDSSAVCFSADNVADLRKTLLDPQSNKWLLLTTLRKLDCLRIEFNDLCSTEIGSAVATLTVHPKVEVAKLAHNIVNKWRALAEGVLFKKLEYDAELAATVPEGEPPAPLRPPPEPTAAQAAADRAEERKARRQAEADYLGSSDDEIEEESESDDGSDDNWRPGGRSRNKRAGHTSGRAAKRRQKSEAKG